MDAEIVIRRLLYIVRGVVWIGSAIFMAWMMQPVIAKTGSPHSNAVIRNMVKPMVITLHSAALLTIVFGVMMAFRVSDPLLDFLWSTDWETMIWVGSLLAVVGYAIGTVGGFTSKKMMDIGASFAGQSPSPEQGAEMAALQKRGSMLTKIASLLALVAVAFMALAQHA